MRALFFSIALLALGLGCQDDKADTKAPAPPKADAPKADPDAIGPLQQAKVKTSQLQIDQVLQALNAYKVSKGKYPSGAQGLGALVSEKFLAKLPVDGWGRPLVYALSDEGVAKVTSLGADGKPGGRGPAADIVAEE